MNKVNRVSFIILGVIMAVSVILLISLLSSLSDNNNDPNMGRWITTNLTWTYILFAITAGAAVLFALYQTLTDLRSAKGSILGIGILILIVGFSYVISSGDIPNFPGVQKFIENGSLTANVSKWVDTGLIVVYSLLGIAVLSLIFSSVSRLFSR